MGRLFWKILLGLWAALLLTAMAIGLVVHWHGQARIADLDALAAGPRADFAIASVASSLRHGGVEAMRELVQQWPARRPFPVLVVDAQGHEVNGRQVPAAALALARQRVVQDERGRGVQRVQAPDGSRYTLFVPSLDPALRKHRRPAPETRFYINLASTLVASLLFSWGLAWYLTRPVRRLRQASRRLNAGDLQTRVGNQMGRRRDEIADLGRDFDFMAARLQALVDAQRTLLHDVSHELRSPLARLEVAVGLARQQPDKLATMLDRIETEAERLDVLVGEVLTLSRLEAGVSPGPEECLELSGLLEVVVEDAQFEAVADGRSVVLESETDVTVIGYAELLRRTFENVVRNGIRHTEPGTAVRVRVGIGNGDALVEVCDRGPGLAEAELATMFEPFVRARGSAGQGYGLGLAIAKRAVQAHGGSISARNREQGGMCVRVRLPRRRS